MSKSPMNINEQFGWEPSSDSEGADTIPTTPNTPTPPEFDIPTIKTEVDETKDSSTIPVIGMKFHSEDEAYNFCNGYAKRAGFSIKKFHVERRKDGTLTFRRYVCSKQGLRRINPNPTHITKKTVTETRTNCMARVEFKIDINDIWTISKVDLNHNHPMTSPNKVHLLRSHRKILPFQRALIDRMTESGIRPHHIYNYFQAGSSNIDIGFIRDDSANYVKKRRRATLDGLQTKGILRYLKERRAADPNFFYAIEAHETGEIANFFWADGKSIIDYAYFGDVICFDTTFQTNEYDMPFAPIVGLNHHKQTIIFGAALLYDESAESFIWVFETFLQAMSSRQPVTIFTDQSAAISRAIETVFPNSAHRLCLWHIFQNAATNLSHVIGSFPKFVQDFQHCIYERCTIQVFENMWEDLLNKYNLRENDWLSNFYKIRTKWAACHRVETFSADMTTTQRSESMNCHFKRFFKRKSSIFEFLDQYDKAITFFREKEVKADFKNRNSICTSANSQILREAAAIYTSVIYQEFSQEVIGQLDCCLTLIGSENDIYMYKSTQNTSRDELVTYNPTDVTMTCTCKMFESKGMLCMHSLKVLSVNNIISLPKHYILKRWTKYAREGNGNNISVPIIESNGRELLTSMYSRICQKGYNNATKSLNSRKALEHIEKTYDKLTSEVEDILRNNTEDNENDTTFIHSNDIDPPLNITIKAPIPKKVRKEPRKKSVLERRRKRKNGHSSNQENPPEPVHNVPPTHVHYTMAPMPPNPLSYSAMLMGASSFYFSDVGSGIPENSEGLEKNSASVQSVYYM